MGFRNSRIYSFSGQILERLRIYFRSSSVHGLKFLAQKNASTFEWWLWTIICWVSLAGLLMIYSASIETFRTKAVSFTADTNYIDWNTTFPAVTICEVYNSETQWDINEEVYGPDRNSMLDDYFAEISFFTGSCNPCDSTCASVDCPTNFSQIVALYHASCDTLLQDCSFNGVNFKCCEQFLPVETEYGICYVLNSIHTSTDGKPTLFSNRSTGPGILNVRVKQDVKIYLHPPEDIVQYSSEPETKDSLILGSDLLTLFKVTEIENDIELWKLPISQRHCRFSTEIPENMRAYKYYSYSTCIIQCKIDEHLRICNCTHHLMPKIYSEQYCNIEGLTCLTNNEPLFRQIQSEESGKSDVECDCLPSCVEPEYTSVYSRARLMDEANGSYVILKMQSLPTEKYVRRVARTYLDLVVSLGSSLGLFFGASLLSVVELLYFLCCRRWR